MNYRFTTSLPYLLNRVGVRMGEIFSERLLEYKVTLPMYRVMAVLRQEGKQSLGDLSNMVTVELSTLSRLIKSMKNRGLVSSIRLEENARMVHIDLTEQGHLLIEKLMPVAAEFESVGTASFNDDQIEWLKNALIQMGENFEELHFK
ncbi:MULTISPECIES: MarR family winged helix-turn-helix transcriptional regulator [Acinetobacter]|uniref:MarR family winged helix-turn-helix transcriptional regulator n=1 Tax=Acinetobacter TaxID=469 RepID=UPI0002AE848C|nr:MULTISPECIES: MarR family transcriptional regulator [Acinetobacter]ELW91361.1 transcriptional regulator, MarR family [Acinetobacter sp. WC-743]KKW81588.1 MarR family transcriptional regulator [Acinetobacter sp. Ag2]MBI0396412.1 MarR family transcriptional regulator [Acinetobacter bereziniae]MBJ8428027.1 MarR family transcriptional regulator [Acinetobacter bereziniae]MBJ8454203.1 MarR family transcriptional regulator [Acinetobacter bereziniae]